MNDIQVGCNWPEGIPFCFDSGQDLWMQGLKFQI